MPDETTKGEALPDTAIYGITLNVLGYREKKEWTALALEMDLRGYGETFRAAVQDLMDLVRMQISFAHFKGNPNMVWKAAEGPWWSLYAQVRRDRLEASVTETDQEEDDYSIAGLRIPPAHEIANFSQVEFS